jgi:AcrR family transcriptional regulator
LTKGALYHHFPNKQALGYVLVDEVIRGFVEEHWIQPLQACDDPIDALKRSIMQSGQQMTMEDIALGCPLNNLSQEMSKVDEGFRQRLEKIYQDWRSAIENAIEQGKQTGKVKQAVNGEQFAIVFIATLEGCLGQAKSAQSMELLYSCGQGLMDLLDSLTIE